jgi:multiple sugar transport system substrate-binding protein
MLRSVLSSPWIIPFTMASILAAALLTGRRGGQDETGRPVVVYAHPPCGPDLMALYNPIFDEFQRTHPDIDFRLSHITGLYEDKIKIMFAGKVAPDVIFMYPTALAAWVELGALEPLDTYLDAPDSGTRREDFFPVMLDLFSIEGRLYGLPKDASAEILFYNVEMFEEYGIPRPSLEWTWEDLLEAAKALTCDTDGDRRIDQWGLAPPPWESFVWANGGRILDETQTHCCLLEPEALEGLEFWAALRCEHGVTPTPTAIADLGPAQMFGSGRIGMMLSMYPIVSIFRPQCEFEFDVAPVPSGPRRRVTPVVGSALAVTAQSRNKEAAFEFVRWLTSPEGMRGLLTVESPSCAELARSPAFVDSPGLPKSKEVAVDAMDYARPNLQHPRYFEILDALLVELDKAQRGVIPVREAMGRAVPRVDKILRDYGNAGRED